jgi:hypothetical protein
MKSQKVFVFLNNIGRVRQNIIKMMYVTAAQCLCDTRVMEVQKIKNQKKTKKCVVFKFLTRVKSNMCKKWSVGSIYTLL